MLRSDIERKRLLGVTELVRLPESAYAPDVTERVFATLREQAEIALRAGQSVIVDAVHRDARERRGIADVAAATGAAFTGLWLDAQLATMVSRATARSGDASDATAAVVTDQAGEPLGAIEWRRLDASRLPVELVKEAVAAIGT